MRLPILSVAALAVTFATAGCGITEIASVEGTAPPVVVAEERCLPDHPDCVDTGPGEAGDEPIVAPDITVVDAFVHQPEPRLVVAEPEAVGETFPIFLQEAIVDGTTLRVSFSGGTAPCFVVGHAAAIESEDSVIVDVRAGPTKGSDQESCTVVDMQQVEIQLTRELGDRPLLDGSRVFHGEGGVRY